MGSVSCVGRQVEKYCSRTFSGQKSFRTPLVASVVLLLLLTRVVITTKRTYPWSFMTRDRRGGDRMVVGLTASV